LARHLHPYAHKERHPQRRLAIMEIKLFEPEVDHVTCKVVTFQWEGKSMTFFMDDKGYAHDRMVHQDIPDEVVEAARMEAERNYY